VSKRWRNYQIGYPAVSEWMIESVLVTAMGQVRSGNRREYKSSEKYFLKIYEYFFILPAKSRFSMG
jgi:hypothetical protein